MQTTSRRKTKFGAKKGEELSNCRLHKASREIKFVFVTQLRKELFTRNDFIGILDSSLGLFNLLNK